jgi:ferredoxin-thioredoxin reductase catalytic subunit
MGFPEGWKMNPDKARVLSIERAISRNEGYCPCEPHHKANTKCPCFAFRYGMGCKCGLYVEEKKLAEENARLKKELKDARTTIVLLTAGDLLGTPELEESLRKYDAKQ